MRDINYLGYTDQMERELDTKIRNLIAIKEHFHDQKFSSDDKEELIQLMGAMINMTEDIQKDCQMIIGATVQQ